MTRITEIDQLQLTTLAGSTSIVGMAVGIMSGGFLIRFFKPGPRALTTFIFCVELFAAAGMISGLFLGCPGSAFHGYDTSVQRYAGKAL